jgi:hypothetical protein
MRNIPAAAVRLAVIAGFLCLAAVQAVSAQAPGEHQTPAPDAGWREKDYLLHYAAVVCVHGAYGTLTPTPQTVLDALDQEAWSMVEFTRQSPETYDRIQRLATAFGKAEAPARALAACAAWVKRETEAILKTSTVAR